MPDTPPRMDREKLARAGSSGRSIVVGDKEARLNLNADDTTAFIRAVNAVAEAWLDREVKKVWDKAWKEVQAEEHSTVHINCPSCGFEGKGSVHATGVVKEIEKAMEAERERCAKIVEKVWDEDEGAVIVSNGRNLSAAIRSMPGKEKP